MQYSIRLKSLFIAFLLLLFFGCESPVKKVQLEEAVNAADMCLAQGNIERAYGIYSNIINGTTNKEMLAHVYTNRGLALMQGNNFDGAEEDFKKGCNMGNNQSCNYLDKLLLNGRQ